METMKNKVEALVDKAAKADSPVAALNYSQAACNAANALRVLQDIKPGGVDKGAALG